MKTISYNGYSFLVDETGYGCYWLNMEKGIWEPWTFRLFDRFLHKDTIYIDCGAWIGITALYASRLCDECYAFEPDPAAYKILRENIDANGIKNIVTFNEAIADHDGMLTLGNESPTMGNAVTRIGDSRNTFQIPCRTLDALFEQYRMSGDVFIKMDVEGAEEYILRDVSFFEKWKPTLYLSTHQQWFKNPIEGMETVRKVGRLYKHCLHSDGWEMKIEDGTNGYVFTERL
jgi:FkbM family methyltransferase